MLFRLLLSALMIFTLAACDTGGDSVEKRVADAHKRYDGPAIWEVSDMDSTLYLFGSVHLLPKDFDWQRRDLAANFDAVGTVFFEDPDGAEADLKRSIIQRDHGLYDTGERLRDKLDQGQLNRLTAAAHNVDIPLTALDGFKPWLAADLLIAAAADAAGLNPKYSADRILRDQARRARKQVLFLDEPETYTLAVSTLPEWVQLRAFEETITNINDFATETRTLNAAWVVGQIEWIEQDTIKPMRDSYPEIYKTLFEDRNARWCKTLDDFLHGDTDALVVVGIGHMLGEDGLPSRLRELGYDVKRVTRFDLPND